MTELEPNLTVSQSAIFVTNSRADNGSTAGCKAGMRRGPAIRNLRPHRKAFNLFAEARLGCSHRHGAVQKSDIIHDAAAITVTDFQAAGAGGANRRGRTGDRQVRYLKSAGNVSVS